MSQEESRVVAFTAMGAAVAVFAALIASLAALAAVVSLGERESAALGGGADARFIVSAYPAYMEPRASTPCPIETRAITVRV